MKLEKSQSENPYANQREEKSHTPRRKRINKSASFKTGSTKDQNFKVVVRVRPPLEREIDPTSGFTSVTQISQNNK